MIRKIALFSSAALLASAMFVGSAQGAAPAKQHVNNDSVTCSTLVGKADIKPALSFAGTATSVAIKIKAALSGCVNNTQPGILIDKGSVSGTLTGVTNNCGALLGTAPAVGTLAYKWTANKTTPIFETSSTQAVSTISGGIFSPGAADPAFGTASYAGFKLGTGVVAGAFTGGDAGATSTNITVTNEDVNVFAGGCTPPAKGIKALHFGIATITLA